MEKKNASIAVDMTRGSVTKKLILFALPVAFANLLQFVYNMVDMVVIGQFVGAVGLSAVSIGSDVMNLFTEIGFGFASAGQIVIAQHIGRGDKKELNFSIGTLFTTMSILALLVTFGTLLSVDRLLALLNTPPEAYAQAKAYAIVCFCGMIFIYGYNVVSAILRGMGDGKRPLIFIAVAAVSNLILDLLFVAVFHMAAFGAALATVAGQAVSFIFSILYLYRIRDRFGFDFKLSSFAVNPKEMKAILTLGFPLALQNSAIAISSMFNNSWINAYGVTVSAVNGIGAKLKMSAFAVCGAISVSVASMSGQNLGAGKTERIHTLVRVALLISVGGTLCICAAALCWPRQIFGLFNQEAEVLAWAAPYMRIFVICLLGIGIMCPFNGMINGVGNARLAFAISILDAFARICLARFLGAGMGLGESGYWYGDAFAGFVTVLLGFIYYLSGKWKMRKLLI